MWQIPASRWVTAAALALLFGMAFTEGIAAASFTVDSSFDAMDANPGDGVCADEAGACTLRAAIMEANALAGPDTVTIPAGIYILTIPSVVVDTAQTGDLDITEDLQIIGSGAPATIIDGGRALGDGIGGPNFEVLRGVTAGMSDVTVQNGGDSLSVAGGLRNRGTLTLNAVTFRDNEAPLGGGVRNSGTLIVNGGAFVHNGASDPQSKGGGLFNSGGMVTLSDVIFSQNLAATGGAISNFGILAMDATTVDRNTATTQGGGIFSATVMTIDKSTISNNVAFRGGGGLFDDGSSLVVTNSTFSSNRTSIGSGGGILNLGPATFTNVTVANNATRNPEGFLGGGGIVNDEHGNPRITLRNTITSGNVGGDCAGSHIVSEGHNLSSDATCDFTGPGDLRSVDPHLGPLADNGGPTRTHALLPGSRAIDAGGDLVCPNQDQRGLSRPFDGDSDGQAVCDIGAYESHRCLGDVNDDGAVDALDLRLVARAIGSEPGSPRWNAAADVTTNGVVDNDDLHVVLRARRAEICG